MFVRMTHLQFPAETAAAAKEIYLNEIAPVIKSQPGNIDTFLLEPADEDGEYISYSQWESEADLKAFEADAVYAPVIGKIKSVVSKPPVQKYYAVI